MRAEGLDRRLTGPELAVVLGHLTKHRGFKSNSKRDRGTNAPKESSQMLAQIEAMRERLRDYRTVGEMFSRHDEYARRRRNRDGDYTRSVLRDDLDREVRLLFDRQKAMGNSASTDQLRDRFINIAFLQR